MRYLANPARSLDVLGQIDTKRLSIMLGLTPDVRDYRITRRSFLSGNSHVVIRCWAFVLFIVWWGEKA